MNKAILSHLNNLSKAADKIHQPTVAGYKPVSPFKTNKVQKIQEAVSHDVGFKLSDILQKLKKS
jgi:hypothetical protein